MFELAAAVPSIIAAPPAANLAVGATGWGAEVVLAVAIVATAIMLAATIRLTAADCRAETRSRGDWTAIGKMADMRTAPVESSASREEIYPQAVGNDALWALLCARRYAGPSSVTPGGKLGADTAIAGIAVQPVVSDDDHPLTEHETNASPKAGSLDRGKPDLREASHAQRPSVQVTCGRNQRHLRVRTRARTRFVANGGPWNAWFDFDQRPTLLGLPIKIVSNIIVLSQGKQRPSDGERPPIVEPRDGAFSVDVNGGARPHAPVKGLQSELSLEAKRQLFALAQALGRQAAREDEAAERLAERSHSPPEAPVENPPNDKAKEDTS
jgi:hypothetical protein